MMISSSAASLRKLDRSSFTFARATVRIGRALLIEPGLRLRFADDGENFDRRLRNVIEHQDVVDSEAVLRATHAPQPLDAALADLRRSEPQVALERVSDPAADVRRERPEGPTGARGQDDLETHSGQIIARLTLEKQSVTFWSV